MPRHSESVSLHPIANRFLTVSQVFFVLAHWLIRWVIAVALIGGIEAAVSLLTGSQHQLLLSFSSKLPSEELFKIKDMMEKKKASPDRYYHYNPLWKLTFLPSPLFLCQSLRVSFTVSQRAEPGGERKEEEESE